MVERTMGPQFCYRARLVKIVDGDTIDVDIDLGLRTWQHAERLRLHGINTPEVRGDEREAGLAAKQFVFEALHDTQEVGSIGRVSEPRELVVETIKDAQGKYGRWIAIVWYRVGTDANGNGVFRNLNEELVAHGHAKLTNY